VSQDLSPDAILVRVIFFAMNTVIIANGDPPSARDVARWLQAGDRLICADGGAVAAHRLGLHPNDLIGDFDSLPNDLLQQLVADGARLHRHPAAKDETDLELALLLAAAERHDIVVLGALGGRVDHALANMLLLAMPQLRGIRTQLAHGSDCIQLIDARQAPATLRLSGNPGDTVSLLPFGGDAHAIHTRGLAYSLKNESLFVGPARGVSNVLLDEEAFIELGIGMLLCIQSSTEA
jgi:thiamine pyrophosphokinase